MKRKGNHKFDGLNPSQVKELKKSLKENPVRSFRKKRITKLVRVSKKWHAYLNKEAERRDMTISKVVDEACRYHRGERKEQKLELRSIRGILKI